MEFFFEVFTLRIYAFLKQNLPVIFLFLLQKNRLRLFVVCLLNFECVVDGLIDIWN
jgi:hypothetical protein